MPYVIKHKTNDRYISGTKSRKADYDSDGLVSLPFARIYPTKSGAISAVTRWAMYPVSKLINKHKFEMVEVVPIKFNLQLGAI